MRELMRSKIHRATVTNCNEDYVGSIVVDQDLMDQVDIWNHEKVLICDIDNGNRFETYVIPGPRGNGDISIQGAAAKLSAIGHKVIIMAFETTDVPVNALSVLVDGENRFVEYLEGAPNVAQVR